MYHKRRMETTRNTLCDKIPGSELYNTPSFGQNTPCNEALASTERKKNCEGVKLKNLTKKCDTYYTMYHKRRVKTTRNALCGKIPERELYYTPSLGKSTTCPELGTYYTAQLIALATATKLQQLLSALLHTGNQYSVGRCRGRVL